MNYKNSYKNYFKDHYDASFSEKDVERETRWFDSQWRFINSKVIIKPANQVLEIGSGLGGVYKFIERKSSYQGIELDFQAVDFTNRFFKTDCFLNVSLGDFSPRQRFDIVFAIEVIEHFQHPIEEIRKIYELVLNGGVFIGTSPFPYKKNVFADKTHNFVLHPENWKRLFLNAGFQTVNLYPMSFIPFLWRKNKNLNPILPFYCPIPKVISTCLIIARKNR